MARNYLRELSYNCITNLCAGCDLSFTVRSRIFLQIRQTITTCSVTRICAYL
jgi:hypothetical protein